MKSDIIREKCFITYNVFVKFYFHKKKIEEPFGGLDGNKSVFPKALMKFFDIHSK